MTETTGWKPRIERLESLILKLRSLILQIVTLVIGPGASTVVWRPGGVTHGNVFATWPEVVAAVAKMQGAVDIVLDNSLAAAVISAGSWDLRPAGVNGPVRIINGTKTTFGPFITIANAPVTLHGLTGLRDISIDNQSTVDVISINATNEIDFYLEGGAAIFQNALSGGAAFIKAAQNSLVLFMRDFSFISTLDTGTNAVQISGGNHDIFIADDAAIDVNQIARTGGTVNLFVSAAPGNLSFAAYATQVSAPTVFPHGMEIIGSSTIAAGTGKTAAIPAFINGNTVIEVTLKTPVGDANTVKYAALAADRVNGNPGSFKISALTAAGGGAVNGADTSTVDWRVVTN